MLDLVRRKHREIIIKSFGSLLWVGKIFSSSWYKKDDKITKLQSYIAFFIQILSQKSYTVSGFRSQYLLDFLIHSLMFFFPDEMWFTLSHHVNSQSKRY
jgi:hypothetical protein